MPRPKLLTDQQKKDLWKEYQKTKSIRQASKKFGIHESTAGQIFHKYFGLAPLPNNQTPPEMIQRFFELKAQGLKTSMIASRTGYSYATIIKYIGGSKKEEKPKEQREIFCTDYYYQYETATI